MKLIITCFAACVVSANTYESYARNTFLGFPSGIEETAGLLLDQVDASNVKSNVTNDEIGAVKSRQSSKQHHVIELKNFMNVQYYGDFQFSSNQHLPAIYDTGSFEILALSTQCAKCVTLKREEPSDHPPLYNRKNSEHFHLDKNGLRAEHVFGSGPVTSSLAYDDILFGGFTVKDMPFWEIEEHDITAWEVGAKFSAIVGLGKENRAPVLEGSSRRGIPTLLEKAEVSSFSICLNRGPGFPSGHLELNTEPPAPSIVVPVIADNHWGVRLSAINMAGQPPIPVCAEGCAAVIDSGTSLLVMPSVVAEQLKLSSYSVNEDCSNLHSLPDLEVTLDGKLFRLPPSAYVVKEEVEVVSPKTRAFDDMYADKSSASADEEPRNKTICSGGYTIMDDMPSNHGPLVILGMPFLRRFRTTFVRDTDAINAVLHIQPVDSSCNAKPMSSRYQNNSSFHIHQTTIDGDPDQDEPVVVDKSRIRPPHFAHETAL